MNAFPSQFNLNNVTNMIGGGLSGVENSMMQMLQQIQSEPNPSMTDLLAFQMNLQVYSSMIQLDSSIIKIYGDTMKQIVVNTGS